MNQAMTRTTPVRTAVPRLESTPSMPIFPRMEVRLANTAERAAKRNQPRFPFPVSPAFSAGVPSSFFTAISQVPTAITAAPAPLMGVIGSPSRKKASRMVSSVLVLSTGVTWLTSPNCRALK